MTLACSLPAMHRRRSFRFTLPAWNDHILISWVFLRALGLIYPAAFASLGVQIEGLVGSRGILPLTEYLDQAHAALGTAAWWRLPTLFWLDAADATLQLACWAGVLAALLVVLDRAVWLMLAVCYLLYLSLTTAGQVFTSFQWDLLLLEAGFLALFLSTRSSIVIGLYQFLIFRFMLMGGIVKLASGDPAWRHLTALNFHFETEPLPSPLAWQAHHLPGGVLEAATAAVLIIELLLPFLVWLPRPFRLGAAISFIGLQVTIILTGNFAFFNLLTLALCLFLFEDRDLGPLVGPWLTGKRAALSRPASSMGKAGAGTLAVFVLTVCGTLIWLSGRHIPAPSPLHELARVASDFGIVNGYGPFAVMTTERREISIEGSRDGVTWAAYGFRYKPDATDKPLTWNIPHQPRLDWQFWFAALGDASNQPWLPRFSARLREGSVPVLALLSGNPFPDVPPRYVRASIDRYRYTTPEERARSGHIWRRERLGTYFEP